LKRDASFNGKRIVQSGRRSEREVALAQSHNEDLKKRGLEQKGAKKTGQIPGSSKFDIRQFGLFQLCK
jgi:hypothetical protein